MTKRKRIKVTHTKLGRERAWGQAHIGEFSIRFYKYLCRVIHVKLFSFGTIKAAVVAFFLLK